MFENKDNATSHSTEGAAAALEFYAPLASLAIADPPLYLPLCIVHRNLSCSSSTHLKQYSSTLKFLLALKTRRREEGTGKRERENQEEKGDPAHPLENMGGRTSCTFGVAFDF